MTSFIRIFLISIPLFSILFSQFPQFKAHVAAYVERNYCGVAINDGEKFSLMINEEDHLRIQVMNSGLDLDSAWEQINRIDDLIEKHVTYAFHDSLGYLTACPTNALVFGDLTDANSRVSRMAHDRREYRLLEELGTEPSVYYLKKIDPHAEQIGNGGHG